MPIEDDIKNLENVLREDTDISRGIKELFKDSFTNIEEEDLEQHDVDIRTRLIQPEIASMSVSNFLGHIKMNGLKPHGELLKKGNDFDMPLTKGLSVLMWNLKRHKISLDGKSRNEIIDILKGSLERKKSTGFFRSLITPKDKNG